MRISPAKHVITEFGGVRVLARLLDVAPSTVCRWDKPRCEGGTGGKIPTYMQDRLYALAREHRKDITADDLIHGRTVTTEKIA